MKTRPCSWMLLLLLLEVIIKLGESFLYCLLGIVTSLIHIESMSVIIFFIVFCNHLSFNKIKVDL